MIDTNTEKILKELCEVRFVKSQKKGWVAITKGDRDWDSVISEDEMMNRLINEAELKAQGII